MKAFENGINPEKVVCQLPDSMVAIRGTFSNLERPKWDADRWPAK
jgi:hypothetical protein